MTILQKYRAVRKTELDENRTTNKCLRFIGLRKCFCHSNNWQNCVPLADITSAVYFALNDLHRTALHVVKM